MPPRTSPRRPSTRARAMPPTCSTASGRFIPADRGAAGASHATHLFNGMRPLHHREPGPVGALLDRDEVSCEVIADGVHLHDTAIRLVARAAGPGRLVLITDAMAAAGMPDGRYRLRSGAGDVAPGGGRAPRGGG